MSSHAAFFELQDRWPGAERREVLEMLKGLDRVEFNANNGVFTYVVSDVMRGAAFSIRTALMKRSRCSLPRPTMRRLHCHGPCTLCHCYCTSSVIVIARSYDRPLCLHLRRPREPSFADQPELTITTEAQLRIFVRTHSTPTQGIPIKTLREAQAPIGLLEDLEKRGDVLIMRSLTGHFKDVPLPRLGRVNGLGMGLNEGGNGRWKSVWWDEVRERGRAGERRG